MCDSCSTAISTESNPQDLKVLNHLVLSSVKGEVNRNVLMPNRMGVSSLEMSEPETCLLERRYLTIKARLAQKYFWDVAGTTQGFTVWTISLCQQTRQHL